MRLIHSHQDQVTKLPVNAELIAKNDRVPVAMFRVGDHIMSMQGHPEFSEDYAHDVANLRKEILGEKVFSKYSHNNKHLYSKMKCCHKFRRFCYIQAF